MVIGWRNNRQDGGSRIFVTRILRLVIRICFGVSVRDGSGLVVSSVFVDIVIFDLLDAFCM